MQAIKLEFTDAAGVPGEELSAYYSRLTHQKERVISASRDSSYHAEEAYLYTPFDGVMQKLVTDLANKKKEFNPALVILIGIGGSNLGALAVYQALYGTISNEINKGSRFFCADTIDDAQLKDLMHIAEATLVAGKNCIVIVVSKSGSTLETMINASFFIELLKKYHVDTYRQFLVYITDEDSPLWACGVNDAIDCLPIPKKVGGRYSVFSAAGLFPLALLDVDIARFCAGALAFEWDEAALSACLIYYHYNPGQEQGKRIHDLFLFSPRLANMGAWYRQLMAESLGKRKDRQGFDVCVGITPVVSIGTTDLHSMVQLALAGPANFFTTFVIPKEQSLLHAPRCKELPTMPGIYQKSVDELKWAIASGVQNAYVAEKRPFMTLMLSSITPESLGALMYFKMMEILYLGYLLNVNPFDQPQVELYKMEARKILEQT